MYYALFSMSNTHWQDIAAYRPETDSGESIFIDDARSEVLFLAVHDREAIYSVGHENSAWHSTEESGPLR